MVTRVPATELNGCCQATPELRFGAAHLDIPTFSNGLVGGLPRLQPARERADVPRPAPPTGYGAAQSGALEAEPRARERWCPAPAWAFPQSRAMQECS